MRLFYQKQNLIETSNSFQSSSAGWVSPTNTLVSTSNIAPDSSSLSEAWKSNTTSLQYLRTDAMYKDNTESVFILSCYMHPVSDHTSRSMLAMSIQPENITISSYFYFTDTKEFSNFTLNNTSYILNSGYYDAGNGWYRMFIAVDPRGLDFDYFRTYLYINAPSAPPASDATIAVWGVQVEETKYRDYVNALQITDGSSYNKGDFDYIEFSQLPSELSETYFDTYENKKLIDGSIKRVNTNVDSNLKYMKWSLINYKTHGDMIYKLRESMRDNLNDDCVLDYEDVMSNTHKYATIRVVDFEINYLTDKKDYAEVTLSYYVLDTKNY